MNRSAVFLLVVFVIACSPDQAAEPDFAARIDAFEDLRRRPFPADFDESEPTLIEAKHFDLSEYFNVFPHLRVREGMVLDWVYDLNELAGGPVLYARKESDPPFNSFAEFVNSIRERAQLVEVEKVQRWYDEEYAKFFSDGIPKPETFNESITDADLRRKYDIELLQGVRDLRMDNFKQREYWNFWREDLFCDGSDEGFKELAALYLMANEFFLFWHAKTQTHRVFASREQMIEGIEELPPGFFKSLEESDENREEAVGLIDPSPTVVRHGGKVQVRLLIFEEAHGYVRKVFTFSETPPHVVLSQRDIVEVEYLTTRIF